MAAREVERKLTAVFVTDVAGYSRLMAENPDQTLETLTAYRQVFSVYVEQFHGRIVNRPGDSILAEFGSVVDALTCAVEIQRELAERNLSLPENSRMHFRIGLTMGDVLLKDGELYGDGVNIAARLEALADPGGICISRNVHDQVQSRLPLHFEYLGEKIVKNIPEPVRAYKVLSEPGAAAHRAVKAGAITAKTWRRVALAAAVLGLIALVGVLAWNLYRQSVIESALATFEKEAAFPLPAKPSIVVLPFGNLSENAKDEWFSDGITETITTDLSKIKKLFVIARNSAFAYKGKNMDVRSIARELGVAYVLEGSVQKSGDRLRINAQLIEAATGNHLWAERYDRKLEELFTLQSEIAEKIVAALETQLTLDEVGRIRRGTTNNVKAWEHYVRGMHELNRSTPVTVRIAKAEFKKALEMDQDFVAALLGLGWVHLFGAIHFYTVSGGLSPSTSRELATELARRVITLDKNNAESFALLSQILLTKGQHDMSISHARNAVELHPNGADWHAYLAEALALSGRGNEALKEIDFTLRLNPTYPESYYYQLGLINYIVGRFEEAIPPLERLLERASTQTWGSQPDKSNRFRLRLRSRFLLIASLSAGGRISQAKQMAAEILELWPYLYMTEFIALRFKFKNPEDMERMVGHLVQAGLPE